MNKHNKPFYLARLVWLKFKRHNYNNCDISNESGLFQLYHYYKIYCKKHGIKIYDFDVLEIGYNNIKD